MVSHCWVHRNINGAGGGGVMGGDGGGGGGWGNGGWGGRAGVGSVGSGGDGGWGGDGGVFIAATLKVRRPIRPSFTRVIPSKGMSLAYIFNLYFTLLCFKTYIFKMNLSTSGT